MIYPLIRPFILRPIQETLSNSFDVNIMSKSQKIFLNTVFILILISLVSELFHSVLVKILSVISSELGQFIVPLDFPLTYWMGKETWSHPRTNVPDQCEDTWFHTYLYFGISCPGCTPPPPSKH